MNTPSHGVISSLFTEPPCKEMEELKCLTCTSQISDEDCREEGEYEGCDEGVSIWTDINTADTIVEERNITLYCRVVILNNSSPCAYQYISCSNKHQLDTTSPNI